jgi:hypothetical protein
VTTKLHLLVCLAVKTVSGTEHCLRTFCTRNSVDLENITIATSTTHTRMRKRIRIYLFSYLQSTEFPGSITATGPSLSDRREQGNERRPPTSQPLKLAIRSLGSELQTIERERRLAGQNLLIAIPAMFTQQKSDPINIGLRLSRTESEIQLCEDEQVAEYRDYCMYVRIISGMSQSSTRSPGVDQSLANIIRTRHADDASTGSKAADPMCIYDQDLHPSDLAFKAVHFQQRDDARNPVPRHLPLTPNPTYYYPSASTKRKETTGSRLPIQDVESEGFFTLDL